MMVELKIGCQISQFFKIESNYIQLLKWNTKIELGN